MGCWTERREGWNQQTEDARSAYDIDYGRIIHSASFRRLQGKTQILNLGDSDFYRTRLTHSLEVAQIATGIVRQLSEHYGEHPSAKILPDYNLVQAICLAHDIGHPPFGHGGETALNYCMRDAGGFEANGQSLRILSKLEKFSKEAGSNLTRRALLGILKYPISYSAALNNAVVPDLIRTTSILRILDNESAKPPKCFHDVDSDVVEWILSPINEADRSAFSARSDSVKGKHYKAIHKSFDCNIMDISDDIAYGVHDLEDVIALDLINESQFRENVSDSVMSPFLQSLRRKYPSEFNNDIYSEFLSKLFGDGPLRKRQIGRLVHFFITGVEPYDAGKFSEPILRYRVRLAPERDAFLNALKGVVVKRVIKSPNVQHLEFKGQQMVVAVFEAFSTDAQRFLPELTYQRYSREDGNIRVICDHIAGMTDNFLLRTYERLFSPRMGSVFDRL